MNGKKWYAAEVLAPPNAQEAIEYGLMEGGALGTETLNLNGAQITVLGYFDKEPEIEDTQACVRDALRIYNLPPETSWELSIREVPDRDWLAEWKKSWKPVEVGRFIIAPPWIESPTSSQIPAPVIIKIEPGMAFGTGTHETTRLCLKAIEKYFRGASFLDVGTGTGILAIAAAKISTGARIEACDTDVEAIEIAKDNARLNGVADRVEFRVGSVEAKTASADFVCANLTAPVIVHLLPELLGATCGRLVLSGILDSQIEMVRSRLDELGATLLETDQDGEWVALVV